MDRAIKLFGDILQSMISSSEFECKTLAILISSVFERPFFLSSEKGLSKDSVGVLVLHRARRFL